MAKRSKGKVDTITGHRVRLPDTIRSPYEVYLNGVPQELGHDFRVSAGELVFNRELVREHISTSRWFLGAWGIGTYERNDSVDVRYEYHGKPMVAQALEIIPD